MSEDTPREQPPPPEDTLVRIADALEALVEELRRWRQSDSTDFGV